MCRIERVVRGAILFVAAAAAPLLLLACNETSTQALGDGGQRDGGVRDACSSIDCAPDAGHVRDGGSPRDGGPSVARQARTICAGGRVVCQIDRALPDIVTCVFDEGLPRSEGFDRPTTVACGENHVCVVARNETRCFGENLSGQTDVPEGTAFETIAAGFDHTCGLDEDGMIHCWGRIASPPGGRYVDIVSGRAHVCAIAADGSVRCFGANQVGQAAPPDANWRALGAGGDTTCATTSVTATCWGAPIPEFPAESQIAVGENHACGLNEGAISCVGGNENGQLNLVGDFEELAAAAGRTCGRRRSGAVECAGTLAP